MSPDAVSRTLTAEECWSLLRQGGVGRVAVAIDGSPHIVPVNFASDGNVVVFRTAPGTVVNEVALAQVAFETDSLDPGTRSGWSVVVHGYGREISDAIDSESVSLRALPIDCWAPGERDQWYKVVATEVTGRRLFRE